MNNDTKIGLRLPQSGEGRATKINIISLTKEAENAGCFEQKLLEKLEANSDRLSLSEKEVAHYINGTSPTLESLRQLPYDQYDKQLIARKAITQNWLKCARNY